MIFIICFTILIRSLIILFLFLVVTELLLLVIDQNDFISLSITLPSDIVY